MSVEAAKLGLLVVAGIIILFLINGAIVARMRFKPSPEPRQTLVVTPLPTPSSQVILGDKGGADLGK